ncbi:MAG TPA: hypothetical protein DCL54_05145 [Alphaproteobacteria bacterium]|nr:hypothetical protein [Alphaproteobacteria bacterium]
MVRRRHLHRIDTAAGANASFIRAARKLLIPVELLSLTFATQGDVRGWERMSDSLNGLAAHD